MTTNIRSGINFFSIASLCFIAILSCKKDKTSISYNEDETIIREVHKNYVQGWIEMDQEMVMSLIVENSRIQPNSMKPIEGKNNIKTFWFPNDDSETIINEYKTEILSIKVLDSIAYTTHFSRLNWSYRKDTINFSMIQKAINTTLYKKQDDRSWKIWRSMWTDIYSERK